MATARHVVEKFKSSDGRIRVKTLSGVSVLVAVIALLVGVLPVFASHDTSKVEPVVVNYGGGPGACSATIGDRLPSAAGNELHLNNPTPGTHQLTGADGTRIDVVVRDSDAGEVPSGRLFGFTVVTPGIVVYDVVVNGGPQNNHYDYDGAGLGEVTSDVNLHAPHRNRNNLHNLSHINICYDVPGITLFVCDEPEEVKSLGRFTLAEATIFTNSVVTCDENKRASFFIDTDKDEVTLAFLGDGGVVAGRLDVTKDFDPPNFPLADLKYDGPGSFVDVQWCAIRAKVGADGDDFDDVLETTQYPSLVGVKDGTVDATACKVFVAENAAGIQYTVVYFEFEDPNFR